MKAEDCKVYDQFFEGNKRQYIIPVYQRNYDWTIEECKNLFNDIISAYDNNRDHFVGSIIQVQKDEIQGIKPFIVIDGQQRLTTIYLLFSALLDFENNNERKEVIIDSLYNNFKGDEPKEPFDKFKLKLKANTYDNKQLILLMNRKFDEVDTTSNIYKNFEYFKNLIKEKIEKGYDTLSIRKAINKLTSVVISLNEDKGDNPQLIFERINSTGLPLLLDDLVRNFVLMTELKQDYLFEEYWSKIEKLVPKPNRSQFLIDYLNAYTQNQVTEKNAYENFKLWASRYDNKEAILKVLVKYAKYYSVFISEDNKYSKSINDALSSLRRLDQSTLYTFLFYIFDDYENNIISENTVLKILNSLVSYSVRRMICEVPSNSLRGLYKNLYKRVFDKLESNFDYFDVFISFMINELKGTKDEFQEDSVFNQYLMQTKLYRNKKLCKYILMTVENNNSKEKILLDSDQITIEHILPQNFENKEWRLSLGVDYERIYTSYLDTLGNLTLTGYNSTLSDNSFNKKKEILENTITKIAYLNKEFKESPTWDENTIRSRSTRLSNDLLSIFNYPNYSGKKYHKKAQSSLNLLDLDNPGSATNTEPIYLIFQGERIDVNSYAKVEFIVIDYLFKINPNILISLSIEKYKPWYPNSERVYLSDNPVDLKKPKEIGDAKIYFEYNISAEYIINFIKRLLDLYQIDSSELEIYVKNIKSKSDSDN